MKIDAPNLPHALTLPADMASMEVFARFIQDTCQELNIGESFIAKLGLVVEELLVNVVHYAYAEAGGDGDIELRCGMADPGTFCIAIRDKGTPFNPLLAKDPDLSSDIDKRPIGGLGVYLVMELADHLDYCRENGANVVKFCKKVVPEP